MIWSALSVLAGQGWLAGIQQLLDISPGQAVGLGWFAPTAIAALIGMGIDFAQRNK